VGNKEAGFMPAFFASFLCLPTQYLRSFMVAGKAVYCESIFAHEDNGLSHHQNPKMRPSSGRADKTTHRFGVIEGGSIAGSSFRAWPL
jgi:hypothetical protein